MKKISRKGCIKKKSTQASFSPTMAKQAIILLRNPRTSNTPDAKQLLSIFFFLHDDDVKMPHLTFMDNIVFPFLNLDMILRQSTEIIAIKTEITRIHFRCRCCHRMLIACGRRRREGKGGKRERRLWDFLLQSPSPFFAPTTQARS